MSEVTRERAAEIADIHFGHEMFDGCRAVFAIEQAVREQTEWLMEPVCEHCGKGQMEMPLSCAGNEEQVVRAEYLRRKGGE